MSLSSIFKAELIVRKGGVGDKSESGRAGGAGFLAIACESGMPLLAILLGGSLSKFSNKASSDSCSM